MLGSPRWRPSGTLNQHWKSLFSGLRTKWLFWCMRVVLRQTKTPSELCRLVERYFKVASLTKEVWSEWGSDEMPYVSREGERGVAEGCRYTTKYRSSLEPRVMEWRSGDIVPESFSVWDIEKDRDNIWRGLQRVLICLLHRWVQALFYGIAWAPWVRQNFPSHDSQLLFNDTWYSFSPDIHQNRRFIKTVTNIS